VKKNSGGGMKTLFAVATVVVLLAASVGVLYAGQFGPVEPTAAPGKVSLGVGYFYSEQQFKSGSFDLGGVRVGFDQFKLRSNQVYGQLSYGFTKNFETYIRVGAADAKLKDEGWGDSSKIYGTAGFRGVFYGQDWFSIGAFLQFNLYSDYKDSVGATGVVNGVTVIATEDLKLKNAMDCSAGFALQAKMDGFTVYGGPFAYWSRIQAEAELTAIAVGIGSVGTRDTEILKDKSNLGVFLGVKVPFTKQLSFTAEGQYREAVSAGAVLAYSF
jgi:hypothetical protein